MNSTINELLPMIKIGLENQSLFSAGSKNIPVTKIELLNVDTISATIVTEFSRINDVKMEVATVIGFFNGFFRNDHLHLKIANYAVSILDVNGEELLYAICSKSNAELLGKSNALDWLRTVYFQENTSDYRLQRAKLIISEIENGLRFAIKEVLMNVYGENWWLDKIDEKIRSSVDDVYLSQFGETISQGNILIDYTFTMHLKKIILVHWKEFSKFFISKRDFESQVEKLNLIRREEAHNRPITLLNIIDLEEIHQRLLAKLLDIYPSLTSMYMVENWRIKISSISLVRPKTDNFSERFSNETNDVVKIKLIIEHTENLISYINEVITLLNSIPVPPQKSGRHKTLVGLYETHRELEEEILVNIHGNKLAAAVAFQGKVASHDLIIKEFINDFLNQEI
ncbi:hypothetical protein SAMN03003324_00133 [Pedobacter antarcticus]|uniref:Swt1-like HEPN domain-containing protein n=1 Tax=Pedobacter antarcticus TaxID=34086 RepID=A0A1I1ZQL2_9SPHI|nr:hypothetical protein [Pedobacter antarcticus]SFE33872.1 hypothetical protein SAMN03003324_00133 [Pedobacter antarcticus]